MIECGCGGMHDDQRDAAMPCVPEQTRPLDCAGLPFRLGMDRSMEKAERSTLEREWDSWQWDHTPRSSPASSINES